MAQNIHWEGAITDITNITIIIINTLITNITIHQLKVFSSSSETQNIVHIMNKGEIEDKTTRKEREKNHEEGIVLAMTPLVEADDDTMKSHCYLDP